MPTKFLPLHLYVYEYSRRALGARSLGRQFLFHRPEPSVHVHLSSIPIVLGPGVGGAARVVAIQCELGRAVQERRADRHEAIPAHALALAEQEVVRRERIPRRRVASLGAKDSRRRRVG